MGRMMNAGRLIVICEGFGFVKCRLFVRATGDYLHFNCLTQSFHLSTTLSSKQFFQHHHFLYYIFPRKPIKQ